MVGQISHPGRQCESRIQKNPVSASDVQLEGNIMGMTFEKPHAATDDEIHRIIDGFAHASEFLEKAGYDGAELHGAHGYVMSQVPFGLASMLTIQILACAILVPNH